MTWGWRDMVPGEIPVTRFFVVFAVHETSRQPRTA